jgi:glycolate dehydrogenase FAD-binding subunit
MTDVAERLGALLGADRVAAGAPARADFAVDGVQPAAVAFPEAPEQVAQLLALASRERWGVIPWGGGSGLGRGNAPARYDVALSLSRLAEVADHDAENLTLTAAAGLRVGEANRRLAASHQMLAIAFADAAHTLGGCVAANPLAPRRLLYGDVRDQLLGLRVALPDGSLVRYGRKVLKNVAGYDMAKLLVGSQGLLGVVVETTFKLFAMPDAERGLLAAFAEPGAAGACAAALCRSRLLPAYGLLLDAAAAAQAYGALQQVAPPGAAHLLVGFEGRAVTLQRQLRDAQSLLREHGASGSAEVSGVAPGLREVLEGHGPAPGQPAALRLRLGVLPTAVVQGLRRVAQALEPLQAPHAIVSDYAAGQLRVAVGAAPESALPALAERLGRLRGELAAQGGYLVLEAAPPALKARLDALGAAEGERRLMRVLARRFDPAGVMAPGRYLGADRAQEAAS